MYRAVQKATCVVTTAVAASARRPSRAGNVCSALATGPPSSTADAVTVALRPSGWVGEAHQRSAVSQPATGAAGGTSPAGVTSWCGRWSAPLQQTDDDVGRDPGVVGLRCSTSAALHAGQHQLVDPADGGHDQPPVDGAHLVGMCAGASSPAMAASRSTYRSSTSRRRASAERPAAWTSTRAAHATAGPSASAAK